ncbi:MAG TPA: radical SAM protein [Rhodocyclaceae bacterium]
MEHAISFISGTKAAPITTEKRSLLFVILPYLEKKKDATKGKTRSFLAFPYGVLSIATHLRRKSPAVRELRILDLNLHTSDQYETVLRQAIESVQPDIVGISMMFDQSYKHVAFIAALAKQLRPAVKVLIGGAAATTAYEEIIADQPDIDALCYSEGEAAMLTLVNAVDLDEAFAHDPWVTRASLKRAAQPTTVYVPHLNDVIDVDYELVERTAYSMKEAFSPFASYRNEADVRQFFLVTSRGCPFKCVFCAEPSLHGKNMRYADVDAIIDHVRFLVDKYGMNVLTIYDDQLLMDMPRAKELFRRLAEFKLRLETPNGVTVVFIDDEMAQLMKQAGLDTLPLAIESGSDYVLRKVIKKPIRLDRVGPVIESLQRNDIFVQAYFVIGLPGEREEDRVETVRCIKEWGVDWSGFSMASPVRGSELYRIAVEKGYIPPNMKLGDIVGNNYILNAPEIGLDPKKISREAYLMNLDVNFVHNRRMRIGDYKVAANCFEEVVERYGKHAFAHYYLAEAYRALGAEAAIVEANRRQYLELVQGDPEWRSYAEEFGMPLE